MCRQIRAACINMRLKLRSFTLMIVDIFLTLNSPSVSRPCCRSGADDYPCRYTCAESPEPGRECNRIDARSS